jgi:hypothetical protein
VVFIISLIVSFISPVVSRFIPFTIPIILHWGLKGIEKLANLQEENAVSESLKIDGEMEMEDAVIPSEKDPI